MARITKGNKSKKTQEEYESGERLSQKFYCIADELIENHSDKFPRIRQCGSSDAMDIYEHVNEDGDVHYDAHCWSCSQVFSKEMVALCSHAEELGVASDGSVTEKKTFEKKPKAEPLSQEDAKKFMKQIGMKGYGYRGISDEANKFYGHLTKVDNKGEVVARYYPETNDKGQIVGFKCRNHPKDFRYGKLGLTGVTNQLSGQVRWKKGGGKYCVPMDTEILTKTGWKYYKDLSVGEIVLGYDQKTNTKQWTKITELHYFEEDDVYSFGSGLNYLRATKDHRWFVEQRVDRGSKGRSLEPQVRTTGNFTSETRLVVNAPFKENKYDVSTELKLSTSKEGDFCRKILNMSHKERVAWLEGFVLADGHYRKPRRPTEKVTIELHQNRGDIFEAALLCSYLVHDKIVRVQKHSTGQLSKNECGKISLSNKKHRTRLTENMKKVSREPVWCVTTELGSWVMKQGDTINITGNCLVVGGEEDKAAALQMFIEYNRARGQEDYDPFPVVSPTTGEGSAYKQLAAQYDWLDTFDGIYLALDSDKAGREALERCIEVLPAEKVYIVTWSGKDPNDMLQKGKQKQFIRDFYNAKPYFNDGIKTSAGLYDAVIEELNKERLTLPPYMNKMQKMMGGGVLPATITNIIADTSVGKSSHVNNCIYHWVMTASETVTIISLEATEGQLGEDLFSLHLGVNLRWMSDEDKDAFFEKEETKEKLFDLMFLPNGQPRFLIIDERDADIEKCEKRMEKAFKQYGSRIFVFDVLTDALRGVASELQESHMVWQKMFIKNDIRIINVLHTRKPPKGKDGKSVPITEYDALGSSTFVQSGAYNILLERDKESDDFRVKNTTRVRMPKCRKGITGKAGDWYFDFDTRQCYDYEEHFGEPFEERGETPSSVNPKKKITKPSSKTKEEDEPPFEPDTGGDDNPFTGED